MSKNTLILNNLSDQYFDKGIAESKKIQYKLAMYIADVRTSNITLPVIFILDNDVNSLFKIDLADTITSDDGLSVIVTSTGKRYKKVIGNYTSKKETFTNLVVNSNTIVLQNKPHSFVDVQVFRNGDLVSDYSINNTIITFLTSFGASTGAVNSEEIVVYYS